RELRRQLIAPAAQRLGGGEVVVRAVAADRQQRDAQGREALGVGDQPVDAFTTPDTAVVLHPGGAFYGGRVPADGGAVLVQHARRRGVGLGGGEAMPDVAVLGDQPQGL